MGPLLAAGLASDGFMLNLGSCMMRLCVPMTEKIDKMDKVDPSYTGNDWWLVWIGFGQGRTLTQHETVLNNEMTLLTYTQLQGTSDALEFIIILSMWLVVCSSKKKAEKKHDTFFPTGCS